MSTIAAVKIEAGYSQIVETRGCFLAVVQRGGQLSSANLATNCLGASQNAFRYKHLDPGRFQVVNHRPTTETERLTLEAFQVSHLQAS